MNLHQFEQAAKNLSNYWVKQAARVKRDLGMGYIPVSADRAPSTPGALALAYIDYTLLRKPFPVLQAYSDTTVYTTQEANWAFRFLHDLTHAREDMGFSDADERAVITLQLREVARVFGYQSDEVALFLVDTVGQLDYCTKHGVHVPDQKAFALYELVGVQA